MTDKIPDWFIVLLALFGIGGFGWWSVFNIVGFFSTPFIEIHSSYIAEKTVFPGGYFSLTMEYTKHKDCIGRYEFRAVMSNGDVQVLHRKRPDGRIVLGAGALGTNPPGTSYSYTVMLQAPVDAAMGKMTVREIDICYQTRGVVYSPPASIIVVDQKSH